MKKKNNLQKKIILIAGPTASGKSKLAISIAKKINGEIINADSMQVYKQLKILTARPNKKEQKKILVGAIPRSGKTYIMAGTILKDVEDAKGADKKSKTKFNN